MKLLKNKYIKFFLKPVITIFILIFIMSAFQNKIGNQENILITIKENLYNINYLYLLISFVIFILVSFISTARIFVLVKTHGLLIGFWDLVKNMYIGYLFNLMLMGSTGGDIVRSFYLTKLTEDKTKIVTVLFLDRFIGMFTMFSLGLVAMLVNLNDENLGAVIRPVFWATSVIYLGLIICALLFSSKRIINYIAGIESLKSCKKIRAIGKVILYTLNETKQYKFSVFLTIMLTVIVQVLVIISGWIAAKSMFLIPLINFKYFFLFIPIILTTSAIPLMPGGLGVGEAAYAFLFSYVGVSHADAWSIALVNRLILIIIAFIGGMIYCSPTVSKVNLKEIEKENDLNEKIIIN